MTKSLSPIGMMRLVPISLSEFDVYIALSRRMMSSLKASATGLFSGAFERLAKMKSKASQIRRI